jgi:hypothetical protein
MDPHTPARSHARRKSYDCHASVMSRYETDGMKTNRAGGLDAVMMALSAGAILLAFWLSFR